MDAEDQETPFQEIDAPFQEIDAHRLAAEVAWVRFFIREARRRGYTVEDIVALLDDPGMTVEAAAEQILSTKGPRPN